MQKPDSIELYDLDDSDFAIVWPRGGGGGFVPHALMKASPGDADIKSLFIFLSQAVCPPSAGCLFEQPEAQTSQASPFSQLPLSVLYPMLLVHVVSLRADAL